MNFQEIKNTDNTYAANTYAKFDLAISHGKGATLYDFEGKSYIDFSGGIAVNIFGACDEEWTEAVTNQLNLVQHTCNLYYNKPNADLCKLLCDKTGMKKVFLGNSGAEANECAIKAARKYSHDKYGDNRYEIITLKNSFHGRTITTLAATGQESFHKHFMPFTEGFVYAEANNIADLTSKVSEKTCAIMVETVQGEGGVLPLSKDFVSFIAKICIEKDILFIIDEVQTGNGRTGKFYGYMHYGVSPDIVTSAKGIGGGLPIGVVLFGDKTSEVLKPGDHGSTFGANPVCCSGAISILSRIDDNLLKEVTEKADYIWKKLSRMAEVESVSGLGLMIGISLKSKNAREIAVECIKHGLIILTAKDKLRMLPPLNISREEIDKGLEILQNVLNNGVK